MSTDTTEKKPRKPRAKAASAEPRPDEDVPPVVATAVAEFQPMVAQLGMLKHHLAGVVYDLTKREQEVAARADRRICVSLRTAMTETHARLKRPIIDRGRELDADLKKIIAAIQEVEKPIDDQIQALEDERERKAEEKRQALAAEVAAIRQKIRDDFALLRPSPGQRLRAETLVLHRQEIEEKAVNAATYGDLTVEAQEAKCATLESYAVMISEAQRWEAEQADLARQRAELAEKRKADEAKAAEERAERDRQQAIEDADRARVREAEQAALKAEADRLAEERRKFAAEQAEVLRVAEEQRQLAAGLERERVEREQAAELNAWLEREEADRLTARETAARAEAERVAIERLARRAPVLLAALETVRDCPEFDTSIPGRVRDVVLDALADRQYTTEGATA